MTRLSDLHGELAKGAAVRWDPRSVDVLDVVQRARTQRSEFIADHLRHGIESFARRSGLTALFAVLRQRWQCHRTLRELEQLDAHLLSDIGVIRADIEATAAQCHSKRPSSGNSVWYGLAGWASREVHRRRTVSALSAMSDEMLTDIGITRVEIPTIAAALAAEQSSGSQAGGTVDVVADIPVSVQVLAFVEAQRSLQRAANQNYGRSTAA